MNELIISSGGSKGYSIIGALTEFIKLYPLDKFKYYTGCSIGALICYMINIGYTFDEINDILFNINFEIFQDLKIINFIEKQGFDDGIKMSNFFKAMTINKEYKSNITFKELYEKTGKILTITVVNITKGIPEYHNVNTQPNLSVILSLRMSSNIPIMFSPILYKDEYYIDGALLDPFPYFYIKNTKKYGIWLFDKNEINFIKELNVIMIDNISNSLVYIFKLLKVLYVNYMKKYYKKLPKNIICISFNSKSTNFESFNVPYIDRVKMFNIGVNKCKIFLKKIYKRQRIKYLSRKYFNIWYKKIKN